MCHVDMTARPQTVTRDQNRTWYDLIRAFKEITGEGIIMNTSFNLAGEPLSRRLRRPSGTSPSRGSTPSTSRAG